MLRLSSRLLPAAASRVALALLLALVAAAPPAAADPGPEQARAAARVFGSALTTGDASALRAILPPEGKVHLRLERLGPEQGYFSAGQVEALLAEFLSRGAVRSFDILRIESERKITLAHARARIVDRRGAAAQVELHLTLQPEDGRWILREIRELAR